MQIKNAKLTKSKPCRIRSTRVAPSQSCLQRSDSRLITLRPGRRCGRAIRIRVRPKTSCSCSCPLEADDRVGQMDEDEIVAGMNFIANLQAAEKVMPSVRPLDHPAVSFLPSLPRGRRNTSIGKVGNVTSPLCRESDIVKVITLITAQMLVDLARRRPVDDERVQRRPKTLLIMDVGSRESYPKRDSLAIDNEVTFRAELSSIGRVFARFIPPKITPPE